MAIGGALIKIGAQKMARTAQFICSCAVLIIIGGAILIIGGQFENCLTVFQHARVTLLM
ncbi:MAG: hypothetical protein QM800_13380 [Paludibacter sp.]